MCFLYWTMGRPSSLWLEWICMEGTHRHLHCLPDCVYKFCCCFFYFLSSFWEILAGVRYLDYHGSPFQESPTFWHLWATLEEGELVVLGHTWNTLWHVTTKQAHNILSKFTILCWATFIAILGYVWPAGHRLDSPAVESGYHCPFHDTLFLVIPCSRDSEDLLELFVS